MSSLGLGFLPNPNPKGANPKGLRVRISNQD